MSRRLLHITEEEWLKRARAANYCAQVLAEHCRVSVSTLSRNVQARTGQSPHEWLLGLRMAWAKKWLAEGMKVICTARELGCESEASFSRQFKAHCGYSPKEHALRAVREAQENGKMNNLDMK